MLCRPYEIKNQLSVIHDIESLVQVLSGHDSLLVWTLLIQAIGYSCSYAPTVGYYYVVSSLPYTNIAVRGTFDSTILRTLTSNFDECPSTIDVDKHPPLDIIR